MTELEQINEKLDKILSLLQPKKEVQASKSLCEVRTNDKKPEPMDFKTDQVCEGWDWLLLSNGSFGFYDAKAYLKALQEWEETNQ